jgi:hypothetical protein
VGVVDLGPPGDRLASCSTLQCGYFMRSNWSIPYAQGS